MRFTFTGDPSAVLGDIRADIVRRLQRASQVATHKAGAGLHADIRSQMRGARLGGLANVIKFKSDERQRVVHPRGAGWSVGSFIHAKIDSPRTAGALESYLAGASIIPRRGRWLAFPTREIPQRVGRRKITPDLYRSGGLEERIGPLKFVKGKGGLAFLVAENVTIRNDKAGQARRLPKRGGVRAGRAQVGIIAFILVRATRRSRRVSVRSLADSWGARLPGMVTAELDRLPARQRLNLGGR